MNYLKGVDMPQNIGDFLTNRARRDSGLEAIYEPATKLVLLIENLMIDQIK